MSKPHMRRQEIDLRALPGEALSKALERIDIPGYILDTSGRLRWTNEAARRLIGDPRGQSHLNFVADEALGVHSRLEAVAAARRHGLLRIRDERGNRE
jgi:hypothetical protein